MTEADFCHQGLLMAAKSVERMTGRILVAYGISLREWQVIATLLERGVASPVLIARGSGLDKVAVTRACYRLEAMGWLTRKANLADQRSHLLQLTSHGYRQSKDAQRALHRLNRQFVEGMSVQDVASLAQLLDNIGKQAGSEESTGTRQI